MLHRRTLTASLLAAPSLARAQAGWPDRPVRLIVPFGAGGAVDTISRITAQQFQPITGQPLVVENRPGAGGTIAGAFVARERPDGYTLMMTDIGANAIGKLLYPSLSYDPPTAFSPICHMVNLPSMIIARQGLAIRDLPDLIAQAKAAPDKFTYASAGIGNGSHLFMELFLREAGIRMTHVPYRSGSELATAVVKGETDFGFLSVSSGLQQSRAGQVKPIAVSALARIPALPEVPLVADVIPGFETNIWHGLAGPAGMDAATVTAANRVFDRIAKLPEVAEQVARVQAGRMVGGSPEQFASFIAREVAIWTPLITGLGIKAE
jgi:tripartite-type tricarboxylate transporter receptor subunit TctC